MIELKVNSWNFLFREALDAENSTPDQEDMEAGGGGQNAELNNTI